MAQDISSFADILSPLTPEEFFADHYGKTHLHVPGTPEKFASVMSWARLGDILNMTGIWSGASLQRVLDRDVVPPQRYCRPATDRSTGAEVLQPDPARVRDLMRPGDLLYIPRGVYHDAIAITKGCVHVSFGATAVIGLDYLSALFDPAIHDPLLRANMPRLAGAGGEEAFAAHSRTPLR